MITFWTNGTTAKTTRKIIESNFRILSKYLKNNMLSLTTEERKSLSADYLTDGLIVFDSTLRIWLEYKNGVWINYSFQSGGCVVKNFTAYDWVENTITILFSEHTILNPSVEVYIRASDNYLPVVGGVEIDDENNITLSSDIAFEGKVIIK